jgi:subtilisin family serine protease
LLPGYDFVDNDNDPSEVGSQEIGPYGHGTHVAGLIALIAPEAKIIPVRVLDQRGLGNVWVLAEALAYAVDPDGNPNTQDGADVINLSLSTLRRTRLLRGLLSEACDDSATSDGFPVVANPKLVIVAAAGNRADTTEQYPAAENINGLIAVGASTSEDVLAAFSTRGFWIDVAAPGQAILSTVPNGQYATWSGTSMAAPIVAGEVALLRGAFPNLRNDKLIDHIKQHTAFIQGNSPNARIDAGAALTSRPD